MEDLPNGRSEESGLDDRERPADEPAAKSSDRVLGSRRERKEKHVADTKSSHGKLARGSNPDNSDDADNERRKRHRGKKRRDKEVSESSADDSEDSEDSERDRRERRKRRKEKRRRREEKDRRKERKKRVKGDGDSDSDSGADDKKRKKLLKKAKKFLKKNSSKIGKELVLRAVGRKVEPITTGDYFQKNAEFATWLREGKGVFFSDLSSEQAHALFEKFLVVYNEGKLPDKYYEGITSTHAQRTGFTWAIKGRGETGEDIMAEEDRRATEVHRSKAERKAWKAEQAVLLEEMLPKATGREAVLEKKAARREQQRGREDSPELMRDKDLLGGCDDFQQRLARERQWREKRIAAKADAVAEKTTAYEAAEQAKLDQFRALIGASGGKISIPKRTF